MPMRLIRGLAQVFVYSTLLTSLAAELVAVRQTQGSNHGYLTLHSEDGKSLGSGEITQVAHGERITIHLIFHFHDGSTDEETTTYLQRGTFQLVRDHHIQKGPFFPKPSDYLVEVPTGTVTSRSIDKDGKEKLEVQHMDLPADVSNGLVNTLLLNTPSGVPGLEVSMIAATGKGRLIHLAITPDVQDYFHAVGLSHKARIFRIEINLGGVAGVVAPIVGKQPKDIFVWLSEGESPGFVRAIGQLYEGGPIVSVELAGATFSRNSVARKR